MKKTLKNVLGTGIVLVGGLVGSADANPGYLGVENNLNSRARQVYLGRDDINFSGATDGFDNGMDGISNSQPDGYPNIFSVISGNNLWDDFRAENSIAPYDLPQSFSGSLSSI